MTTPNIVVDKAVAEDDADTVNSSEASIEGKTSSPKAAAAARNTNRTWLIALLAIVGVLAVGGVAYALLGSCGDKHNNNDSPQTQEPPVSTAMMPLMEQEQGGLASSSTSPFVAGSNKVVLSGNGKVVAAVAPQESSETARAVDPLEIQLFELQQDDSSWLARPSIHLAGREASIALSPLGDSIAIGTEFEVCVHEWNGVDNKWSPKANCLAAARDKDSTDNEDSMDEESTEYFGKVVQHPSSKILGVCGTSKCTVYELDSNFGMWTPRGPTFDELGGVTSMQLSKTGCTCIIGKRTSVSIYEWNGIQWNQGTKIFTSRKADLGQVTLSSNGKVAAIAKFKYGKPQVYVYEKKSGVWTKRGTSCPAIDGGSNRFLRYWNNNCNDVEDSKKMSLSLNGDGSKMAVSVSGYASYKSDNFGIRVFQFKDVLDWVEVKSNTDQSKYYQVDMDDSGTNMAIGRDDKIGVYSIVE